MTTPALCAHCRGPVRGRSPVGSPLCRRALSVAWSGPEDGTPGLVWLAALYGWTWDAPEMVEAVRW